MVRNLLNVIMDGIKDAGMLIDYAEAAYGQDNIPVGDWFRLHAKQRLDALDNDYEYVCHQIDLNNKAAAGDQIAEALKSQIDWQLSELQMDFMRIE